MGRWQGFGVAFNVHMTGGFRKCLSVRLTVSTDDGVIDFGYAKPLE